MRIIFFLFFLCCGSMVSAQSDFDPRLLEKFNADQIESLQESNPEVLAYWTYYLDNGYEIVDILPGKEDNITETVAIENLSSFNVLSLDVTMLRLEHQLFRIESTDQMLVILSNDAFTKKFNAHRGL